MPGQVVPGRVVPASLDGQREHDDSAVAEVPMEDGTADWLGRTEDNDGNFSSSYSACWGRRGGGC